MESILILAHADESGAALTRASLEAVTAGQQLSARLGAPITIGIVASQPEQLTRGLPHAVLAVSGEAFARARYATDAAACEALCRARKPSIVLAPTSSRFSRVMASVAHRLGGFIDTHIASVSGEHSIEASRWLYRQRIEAVLTREARPWFLLLDAGAHDALVADPSAPAAKIELIDVALPPIRTNVTGERAPQQNGAGQTIRPEAGLLFVAGAGWTKKQPDGQVHTREAGELILSFLRDSGASLGSSKSLVDQGDSVLPFLTHLNQVGQTGATPRHRKGLSTCCHGEEPHVVGWRFIGERRAISLDPNCGWTRGKADVVYVADAFQVMARVNELLAAR
jgi:electron transfer flavoprotein alpha subunit